MYELTKWFYNIIITRTPNVSSMRKKRKEKDLVLCQDSSKRCL